MSQPPYPPQGGNEPGGDEPGSPGWNPPAVPTTPTRQFDAARRGAERGAARPDPAVRQPGPYGQHRAARAAARAAVRAAAVRAAAVRAAARTGSRASRRTASRRTASRRTGSRRYGPPPCGQPGRRPAGRRRRATRNTLIALIVAGVVVLAASAWPCWLLLGNDEDANTASDGDPGSSVEPGGDHLVESRSSTSSSSATPASPPPTGGETSRRPPRHRRGSATTGPRRARRRTATTATWRPATTLYLQSDAGSDYEALRRHLRRPAAATATESSARPPSRRTEPGPELASGSDTGPTVSRLPRPTVPGVARDPAAGRPRLRRRPRGGGRPAPGGARRGPDRPRRVRSAGRRRLRGGDHGRTGPASWPTCRRTAARRWRSSARGRRRR